ncbi:chloride channel protein [Gryllotalpicola ginsengisoli]|uniref:chloride channel protein n=1 Tax=Gryllotalpicola ginsengisoli TaxID=444608 RepID=UPI0003B79C25|nr:chloride channel protein [Gryllotalpicola ginsengisoli]
MTAPARRILRLALAILAVGVVVGISSGLLSLLLHGFEQLAFGYVEDHSTPGAEGAPWWRRGAAVIIGGVIAAVAWWLLRRGPRAVPSVKAAVDGARMPWWQTIVHAVLQILIVGTGAPVGREVAPRELGALVGGWFTSAFRIDGRERAVIVAAGAGAGLAGVYNIPLAGALFAVEILLAELTLETAAVALGVCAVAALVASVVEGYEPFYVIHGATSSWSLAVFAAIFGPLFGFLGYWFSHWGAWAERRRAKGATILWLLPAASVLTAVVAIWLPEVMGNGRAVAQAGFNTADYTMIGWLVAAFLAKGVVTLVTIRSGAAGGVLTPAIALGSSSGAAIGALWVLLWPGSSVTAFAVVGAAALLASSQKSPFTAIAIVFELTHASLEFLAPLGVAVGGAILIRRLLDTRADRIRQLDL